MRIAIDISSATARRTGIGTYTYELTRELIRFPQHQFVLWFNSLRKEPLEFVQDLPSNVTFRCTQIPGPLLLKSWQYLNAPAIERFVGKVDLFLAPATYMPPQRSGIRAVTIHDLHFLGAPPAGVTRFGGQYLDWVVRNRLRESNLILTNDPLVETQLNENRNAWLGDDGNKKALPLARTIPHGVCEQFRKPACADEIARTKTQLNLPDRFLLHVGANNPRKNLLALLQALDHTTAADFPQLLLAGASPGAGLHETGRRLLLSLTGKQRVRNLGYISADQLGDLYRSATALVFPSIYEGFGLPILEAMACGCPVVCSRSCGALSFLPPDMAEIVNNPADSDELLGAIRQVLTARESGDLRPRITAAQSESMKFTWAKAAAETIAAFEEAFARKA